MGKSPPENQVAKKTQAAAVLPRGLPQSLPRILTRIFHALIIVVFAMVLVLLAGSVWAVFLRKNPVSGTTPFENSRLSGTIYTGIGRLRLISADSEVIILTISFPFTPEDKPFSEELAARNNDFRAAAAEYFRRFRADDIQRMDEELIKNELLEQFNSLLRLGKIETLYFSDYLVLE